MIYHAYQAHTDMVGPVRVIAQVAAAALSLPLP
jgi:hypothetical protein